MGGDAEGLAEELQGVAEAAEEGVELVGLGLALELTEALGLSVYLQVQTDCKERMSEK